MKKVILSAIVATTLFACGTKTENASTSPVANYPANASGYNLDSTANTATLKKINAAGWAGDVATAKAAYADTAVVFDNGTKQKLEENMEMLNLFKNKGIKVNVENYYAIWESVNNKIDENGVQNYTFAYENVAFSKGDKKVNVILFQVDAFSKDGKIVKEWNIYDASKIADLLK
jgi:hypothetical protein